MSDLVTLTFERLGHPPSFGILCGIVNPGCQAFDAEGARCEFSFCAKHWRANVCSTFPAVRRGACEPVAVLTSPFLGEVSLRERVERWPLPSSLAPFRAIAHMALRPQAQRRSWSLLLGITAYLAHHPTPRPLKGPAGTLPFAKEGCHHEPVFLKVRSCLAAPLLPLISGQYLIG